MRLLRWFRRCRPQSLCLRHDFRPAEPFVFAGGARSRPQYRCTDCGARWLPEVGPEALLAEIRKNVWTREQAERWLLTGEVPDAPH